MNKIVTAFFINGPVPTKEENKEIQAYTPGVKVINAKLVELDTSLVKCDCVGGAIPKRYEGKPLAVDVWEKEIKERLKLITALKKKSKTAKAKETPKQEASEAEEVEATPEQVSQIFKAN